MRRMAHDDIPFPSIMRRFYDFILSFFWLLLPFRTLSPFSHEVRYNPFLGKYTQRSQKDGEMKGNNYGK
jgi:hypothetical protein